MKRIISFNGYLYKVVIITILFFLFPIFFTSSADATTLESYFHSVLCFFALTIISVKLLLNDIKYIKFYTFAYILELLIGIVHYLIFVDPNYFAGNGNPPISFWHEHLAIYDAIERLITERQYNLFVIMDADTFSVTHSAVWHIISWPFYWLNVKWLNFSPLNTFSSLFTSANLMLIYLNRYPFDRKIHNILLISVTFFPLFILNDTLWRDPFCLGLMSTGVVFFALSKNLIEKVVSFFIMGVSSFLHRTVYVVISAISATYGYIKSMKNNFGKVILFFVGCILLLFSYRIAFKENGYEYTSIYLNNYSLYALPIKVLFGLIGPFPWVNFPNLSRANPAFSFYLGNYLMGTFQLGYLYAIVANWGKIRFREMDFVTVMGFLIMLSGFVSRQMNIEYVAEGLLLTLPWFYNTVGRNYKKYFLYSLTTLIFLNVVFLFIGRAGISALWK